MSDIFRFPNGYEVKVLRKEDVLASIDANIIDCGICDVCNSNIMHSFRVEKEGYGLEAAFIGIR